MKRIILVNICLILLFLSSCTSFEKYSTSNLSSKEKQEIALCLNTLTYEQCDLNIYGNLKISGIYYGNGNSFPAFIIDKSSTIYESGTFTPVILQDTDIFSTNNNKYLYLFLLFGATDSTQTIPQKVPLYANNQNGKINLTFARVNSYSQGNVILPTASLTAFVYKIEKSSLSGSIEKLEINIVDSN